MLYPSRMRTLSAAVFISLGMCATTTLSAAPAFAFAPLIAGSSHSSSNPSIPVALPGVHREMPANHDTTHAEQETIRLLNEERVRRGMRPLQSTGFHADLAHQHSGFMAGSGEFHHSTLPERYYVGENILMANYLRWDSCFKLWLNSPSHRDNMLNPAFTKIGVSIVPSLDGNYYATMILGY
ncbi:CAP domain-containing protein [Corynebacterium felinum]|nr:CAP domain-containing protein [Corynebacterium felinum]MDF5821848.1 CAP domain-containing protein [Corynebacterium felinum]WJY94694.1 Cysteine-rich secretory protein family protein [Corynebacterium felinum]